MPRIPTDRWPRGLKIPHGLAVCEFESRSGHEGPFHPRNRVGRALFFGVVWRGVLLRIGGRRSKNAYFWGTIQGPQVILALLVGIGNMRSTSLPLVQPIR